MQVRLLLPALTEATSPDFRPIKYSLFPPLGLATLAGYLRDDDEVTIQDEHVEVLDLGPRPDLVAIEVYITSARRAYAIADGYRKRGVHVALGGLHVTSVPEEAAQHADTIFLGPGEDTWPRFLADLRAGRPGRVYRSIRRSLAGAPPPRRDLIRRSLYLVPNSIVVSRGCPHRCDFCYQDSFFGPGRRHYTQAVDDAVAEIDRLPGRHVYFLDDNLFASPRFAAELLREMRGMRRVWQAAGTVHSVLSSGLIEPAARVGLRSLFIGFETLNRSNLVASGKPHQTQTDAAQAISRLKSLGVMVNASFVFGMDMDDESVFDRTVQWAIEQGVETATFHILTPYPGTRLHARLAAEGRILHRDWDRYDTRHAVFRPARMSRTALETGYRRAHRDFYSWSSIFRAASHQPSLRGRLRHAAYAGGWKKLERFWDAVIRARQVGRLIPVLEATLDMAARSTARQLTPTPSSPGPREALRFGTSTTSGAVPHSVHTLAVRRPVTARTYERRCPNGRPRSAGSDAVLPRR